MYFESEVYGLLVMGFAAVMLLEALSLALLYKRTRANEMGWFAGHMVSLVIAFYFFFRCVTTLPNDPNYTMYSEDQSLRIALAGLSWALSVLMMLSGLHAIASRKDKQ